MTDTEFENLVDKLFDDHAKAVGDHWVNEVALDHHAVHHFARDLRAVLAAANGPLQATTSRPLPVIPWSGSNLTEMEELLQKAQQLERENAALRSLAQSMADEMELHGGEIVFASLNDFRAEEGQL